LSKKGIFLIFVIIFLNDIQENNLFIIQGMYIDSIIINIRIVNNMKLEKATLVALAFGLLMGILLELIGVFTIQDLYMAVTDMNVASWYIILVLVISAVTFVACVIITEQLQMEVILMFIGSYIILEIVVHVFTIIYLLLFGLGWGTLIFMHMLLIMILIAILPAVLLFMNYDKWRDPAIFIVAGFLGYLLMSFVLFPFMSTYFQWVVITLFVVGILAATIISVIVVQLNYT